MSKGKNSDEKNEYLKKYYSENKERIALQRKMRKESLKEELAAQRKARYDNDPKFRDVYIRASRKYGNNLRNSEDPKYRAKHEEVKAQRRAKHKYRLENEPGYREKCALRNAQSRERRRQREEEQT
ncbi:MAG: hypothetical protein FWB87_15755 [Defluviitaleaceae bacterium]|nr:hypothetical protein [Defluviitaleaceae bacterium]